MKLRLILSDTKTDAAFLVPVRRRPRNGAHLDPHISVILVNIHHDGCKSPRRVILFVASIRLRANSAFEEHHEAPNGIQRNAGHCCAEQRRTVQSNFEFLYDLYKSVFNLFAQLWTPTIVPRLQYLPIINLLLPRLIFEINLSFPVASCLDETKELSTYNFINCESMWNKYCTVRLIILPVLRVAAGSTYETRNHRHHRLRPRRVKICWTWTCGVYTITDKTSQPLSGQQLEWTLMEA